MKLIKLLLLVGFTVFISVNFAFAQDKGIGLRAGLTPGINFKSFQSSQTAYELILGKRDGGSLLTGILEFIEPASALARERFTYYYGFGCHIGYYREDYSYHVFDNYGFDFERTNRRTYPAIGFDGIFGLEYRFQTFPLSASADYKPYFNLFGPNHFFGKGLFDFGFSLKYLF
ncbi:MAG: hypothetical protein HOD63_15390 [Bacteroidetes bacterium]|jgi:hypothetical protein|nr:hypothetical protein [Bacteroidota bacterium]MBT5530555.1 hypothetical protein [Cytophagia bacterium]MBT3421707.1 hypothetical protein [Bacteroidota bacterium]MBT3800580.1 hypothetical protein [Bacteroidota bacterium]MBT3934734.1 hypothetical protein [Bacteroidota bacterium]